MPAPFQHSGLSTFMGSWPVVPSYIGGTPTFDPRAIEEHAVILGVKRETSAGFNVAGKTMYLWVDGLLVTFRKTINFNSYSDPYTLDQVISEINADAVKTVAFNDNGFLRLQSENTGETGYLKLGTFNDPDVFHELGLFTGTEVYGGQLKQAKHFDPDRQVAFPGQAAIGDGENFRADVFNRALHQLAVNTDRTEGVIGRKRIATQEVGIFSSYSPTGTPAEEGIQFSGGAQIFTGDTQTISALENLFAVLDADGREFTKKVTTVLTTDTITFTYADGRQIATDTGGNFVAGDEADEVYVVSSDGTLPAALQGVPLKILEVETANIAVIQPIDPATGDVVLFTTAGVSADRIDYSSKRCKVDEIRVSQGGARVEGVQEQKSPPAGTHVPTRIDLNNRIVVSGATFLTDDVQVGDLATWSSYGVTNPYSNNGDYRVSRVIDEETIEVVAEDWGPAFLNPDLTVPGDLVISTDGMFYEDPFVHFLPEASGGAIPESGDYVKILYLGMTDFRTATNDPSAISGGGVRYHQEADDTVQKAILAIIGPSAVSINDYLHDDARNSMENIDYRLDFEHYPSDVLDAGTGDEARQGRHKDIRPDHINMWEGISGETLTVRGGSGETTVVKAAVRDVSDVIRFSVTAEGHVESRYEAGTDASLVQQSTAADLAKILAQAKTTGGVARLDLLNGANTANPRHFATKVEGTNLVTRIENDGAGASLDVMTISNDGTVTISSNSLDIALPGATGTAMNVTYSGGVALRMDVNASGECELWAVGDGYQGGGNVIIRGAAATTSGNDGGEAYLLAGDSVDDYGGWTGIAAGKGDPGGNASVNGGDALSGFTDANGGDAELYGGDSTGSGYSRAILRAATAGASGTTTRPHDPYLSCNGAVGLVELYKDLDTRGKTISDSIGDVNFGDDIDMNTWNAIINLAHVGLTPHAVAPAAAAGNLYVQGQTKKINLHNGASWDRYIPQSYAAVVEQELTYTASTEFSSLKYTIPAGTLRAGSTIRIRAAGYVSVNGAGNALSLYLTEGAGPTSDAISCLVSAGGYFYYEAIATVWTTGVSGNFRFYGQLVSGSIAGAAGAAAADGTTAVAPVMDTTQAITVSMKGFATGSSTTDLRMFTVDVT